MTLAITVAVDEHELECEQAVAEAVAAEIDAELADEPLEAA